MKFLLLTEAFAVATFALSWWAVPVLAFLWAVVIDPKSRPVFFATVCAIAAWCGVLLLDAARGPLLVVAERFGGVLGFPPVALIAITILFSALLAWSASSVGSALRRFLFVRRPALNTSETAAQPRPGAAEVAVADV